MKTSHEPTSRSGADEWTCSLAAFRASLSVMPGDAEARRMTATSGDDDLEDLYDTLCEMVKNFKGE